MESLALLVSLIVIWLLALGPVGMAASWLRFPIFGAWLGALSVISGAAYLAATPTAPWFVGAWAVGTGLCAVHIGMMTLLRTRE